MQAVEPKPIPSRVRPFEKTQAPTPWYMKTLLKRDMAPTAEEYDRLIAALWQGDGPMDTLVEWMFEYGPGDAKALIEQAVVKGVGTIEDCPQPLLDFFETLETPPAWIDQELVEEGVRFIHGIGITAEYVLRDLALMGGYLLSGFNQSLVLTGALNKGAAKRIAETGKWWIDCTEPYGLTRYGVGFKSTIHVRMIHSLVRRNLAKKPQWDSSKWGLPLSQIDMVATYLGFSVVLLGGLRKLGVPVTPRESKAVMHLWAYACWIMGVEEKWLVQTEREGIVLLNHTYMTQSKPDDTSRELAQALADEPLERTYKRFEKLRRQFSYHQHLSISQYFLGDKKIGDLGLPKSSSWYALLSTPPRFASYTSQRFNPLARKAQQKHGRRQQKAMLGAMFGQSEHGVIAPDEHHPAHVQ
ncbi:MAG: DUF2236 domain-containing protein [Pseudomonadales bacterium]|nr:DUF2236 domain-containing protein [Pseudomonadales bacterium]